MPDTVTVQSRHLEAMYRAFVHIRVACQSGDINRAEDIADAFHNFPHTMAGSPEAHSLEETRELFFKPLVERHRDLDEFLEL